MKRKNRKPETNSSYKLHLKLIAAVALHAFRALLVRSTLPAALLPYPPTGLPTHPNSLSLASRARQ